MNDDMRTHKNEDAIGIAFPTLCVLAVLFLCGFGVCGEELSRAVTKAGFFSRWQIRCRQWQQGVVYFYTFMNRGMSKVKTHLARFPYRSLQFQTLRCERPVRV